MFVVCFFFVVVVLYPLFVLATFEALLSPEQNKGTGAMVTMFYDTSSHVASFTVHIGGIRSSKLGKE